MHAVATFSGAILLAASLSGCLSAAGPRESTGTLVGSGVGAVTGGIIGGALGGSNGAIVGAVTGGVLGGVTGNALGRDLDEQDRIAAMDAQAAAFQSGQRRPWRGARGAYGYVEPGPIYVADDRGTCRNYTHRIFVGGRPATTTGLACLGPDGVWQIVG